MTNVDLARFGTALDSFSEIESWLINPRSGEIRCATHEVYGDGGVSAGCEEADGLIGAGWLEIHSLSLETKHRDAQEFVARLHDAGFRAFLARTLDTKMSLFEHRFKETLLSFPMAKRYWEAFKAARLARHAIAWLHAHELLTADEAQAYAARFPDPDGPPALLAETP